MDIRNLSKIKRIYQVKVDEDYNVHVTTLPVVYINKNWVYCKRARGESLKQTHLSSICDSTEFMAKNRKISSGSTWKFFDVSDEFIEYIKESARTAEAEWMEQKPWWSISFTSNALRQYKSEMEKTYGDEAEQLMGENIRRMLCELNLESVLNNNTN